ncbi:MAG: class I SAM-dependent methyltransferase [Alphaproteobacteria bacterium]
MREPSQPRAEPAGQLASQGLGLPLKAWTGLGRVIGRAGEGRLISFVENHLRSGVLTIEFPSGDRRTIRAPQPGVEADLLIRSWQTIRRLFAEGSVGFADAYIDGHWDSSDLGALLELLAGNRLGAKDDINGQFWSKALQRLTHAKRPNTKQGSRRNIAAHYDVGNEFYQSWLDETMTYSSAIFAEPDMPLAEAQREKYRRLLDLIDPAPGERILEIGCGWGGFAEFAARERAVEVTSITISEKQYDFARERIRNAGLDNQVSIEMRDYRDVTETYDHVASIEMFEAVGEEYWPAFFDKVASSIRPGGRAGLQIITINDEGYERYRNNPDFIQTHIFPGGMLPSIRVFREHVVDAGMRVLNDSFFGKDYAHTLHLWRERFEAAADTLTFEGLDERFRRLWRYYLAYCEGGFRAGTIDVMQVGLTRD